MPFRDGIMDTPPEPPGEAKVPHHVYAKQQTVDRNAFQPC